MTWMKKNQYQKLSHNPKTTDLRKIATYRDEHQKGSVSL